MTESVPGFFPQPFRSYNPHPLRDSIDVTPGFCHTVYVHKVLWLDSEQRWPPVEFDAVDRREKNVIAKRFPSKSQSEE